MTRLFEKQGMGEIAHRILYSRKRSANGDRHPVRRLCLHEPYTIRRRGSKRFQQQVCLPVETTFHEHGGIAVRTLKVDDNGSTDALDAKRPLEDRMSLYCMVLSTHSYINCTPPSERSGRITIAECPRSLRNAPGAIAPQNSKMPTSKLLKSTVYTSPIDTDASNTFCCALNQGFSLIGQRVNTGCWNDF